jgi:membrane-associated phospholipid phosphatase
MADVLHGVFWGMHRATRVVAFWFAVLGCGYGAGKICLARMPRVSEFERRILSGFAGYWKPELGRALAALGFLGTLRGAAALHTLVAAAISKKNRYWGSFVALANLGAGAHYVLLNRQLVCRARPRWFRPDAQFEGLSFPSGHALTLMTSALALSCALRELRTPRHKAVGAAALIGAGSIGLSRLYLQAHYPSDVLIGWSLAGLWTLGLYRIFRRNRVPASVSITHRSWRAW